MTYSAHTIGLDLGSPSEPTGLAVVFSTWEPAGHVYTARHAIRHLERFPPGTAYEDVRAGLSRVRQAAHGARSVLDVTAVGSAIADLFDGYRITLSNGASGSDEHGRQRVPRLDLAAAVAVALQEGRLALGRHPKLPSFPKELAAFQPRPTAGAPDAAAWREGTSDDLVLAVAAAVWYGERSPAIPFRASAGRPAVFAPPLRRDWRTVF